MNKEREIEYFRNVVLPRTLATPIESIFENKEEPRNDETTLYIISRTNYLKRLQAKLKMQKTKLKQTMKDIKQIENELKVLKI
jgi:hypothetical protein